MGMVYRLKGRQTWMIRYYRHGKRIVESSGTTVHKDAQTVLRDREKDAEDGQPVRRGQVTYEDGEADVQADYKAQKLRSPRTANEKMAHLRTFFAGRKLVSITQKDITRYIAHRRDEGVIARRGKRKGERVRDVSNGQINRELAFLKKMCRLNGILLKYKSLDEEDAIRVGFFEAEQFASALAQLPAALQDVVTFGYITGWRINSEVLPLEWRQVSFTERIKGQQKHGTVRLFPGMTKADRKGRVFPLTDALRALLLKRQAERDAQQKAGHVVPWVFFRLIAKGRGGAKYPKRITTFDKAWNKACRGAGLPGKIKHDFRRTAARNLIDAGVPERVAMRMVGWKSRAMIGRYLVVSEGDLGAAASLMDRALLSQQIQ